MCFLFFFQRGGGGWGAVTGSTPPSAGRDLSWKTEASAVSSSSQLIYSFMLIEFNLTLTVTVVIISIITISSIVKSDTILVCSPFCLAYCKFQLCWETSSSSFSALLLIFSSFLFLIYFSFWFHPVMQKIKFLLNYIFFFIIKIFPPFSSV